MKKFLLIFMTVVLGCGAMSCRSAKANKVSAVQKSKPAPVVVKKPPVSPVQSNRVVTASDDAPRLKAGFCLRVAVFVGGKKELEEPSKRVSNSGTIALPLIGNIRVEKLTLEEVSRAIETKYAEYYVKPQVVVDFVTGDGPDAVGPWGMVTVLGRVKKPGQVAIPPTRDLTVSRAIQQAGGFDTSANDSCIRVSRRLADGKLESKDVDLHAFGAKGKVDQDLVLLPDDVLFVPELLF